MTNRYEICRAPDRKRFGAKLKEKDSTISQATTKSTYLSRAISDVSPFLFVTLRNDHVEISTRKQQKRNRRSCLHVVPHQRLEIVSQFPSPVCHFQKGIFVHELLSKKQSPIIMLNHGTIPAPEPPTALCFPHRLGVRSSSQLAPSLGKNWCEKNGGDVF